MLVFRLQTLLWSTAVALIMSRGETTAQENSDTVDASPQSVELATAETSEIELDKEPWQGNLRELSTLITDLAIADGRKDRATEINSMLDFDARIRIDLCHQFLNYATQLANWYRNYGQLERADEIAHKVLLIFDQLDEKHSTNTATILTLVGTIRADCHQFADARQAFMRALQIYSEIDKEKIEEAMALWFYLGQSEMKLGAIDRAEEIFHELSVKTEIQQDDLHAMILASLSEVYLLKGNDQKSREYAREAVATIRDHEPRNNSKTSYILSRVAFSAAHTDEFEKAIKAIDAALEIAREQKGFLSVMAARRHEDFADILLMQGEVSEACEHLKVAIETRTGLHGENHGTVRDLQARLFKIRSNQIDVDGLREDPDPLTKTLVKEQD